MNTHTLTRRVHGDRVTDFFLNFVKLKFPYVVKKVTKAYDPLFRNTRKNRGNTWEKNLKYVMYFI